jgi:hypothetical protein
MSTGIYPAGRTNELSSSRRRSRELVSHTVKGLQGKALLATEYLKKIPRDLNSGLSAHIVGRSRRPASHLDILPPTRGGTCSRCLAGDRPRAVARSGKAGRRLAANWSSNQCGRAIMN